MGAAVTPRHLLFHCAAGNHLPAEPAGDQHGGSYIVVVIILMLTLLPGDVDPPRPAGDRGGRGVWVALGSSDHLPPTTATAQLLHQESIPIMA